MTSNKLVAAEVGFISPVPKKLDAVTAAQVGKGAKLSDTVQGCSIWRMIQPIQQLDQRVRLPTEMVTTSPRIPLEEALEISLQIAPPLSPLYTFEGKVQCMVDPDSQSQDVVYFLTGDGFEEHAMTLLVGHFVTAIAKRPTGKSISLFARPFSSVQPKGGPDMLPSAAAPPPTSGPLSSPTTQPSTTPLPSTSQPVSDNLVYNQLQYPPQTSDPFDAAAQPRSGGMQQQQQQTQLTSSCTTQSDPQAIPSNAANPGVGRKRLREYSESQTQPNHSGHPIMSHSVGAPAMANEATAQHSLQIPPAGMVPSMSAMLQMAHAPSTPFPHLPLPQAAAHVHAAQHTTGGPLPQLPATSDVNQMVRGILQVLTCLNVPIQTYTKLMAALTLTSSHASQQQFVYVAYPFMQQCCAAQQPGVLLHWVAQLSAFLDSMSGSTTRM